MMKTLTSIFLFLSCLFLSAQQIDTIYSNKFIIDSALLTGKTLSDEILPVYSICHNKSNRFFNDNLEYSDFQSALTSSLKISGELAAGLSLGYGLAILMRETVKSNENVGENLLKKLFQFSFMFIGATKGTSLGVYTFGKMMGDEGSFMNTYFWSIVVSSIFYFSSKSIASDISERLKIAFIGLNIGAVIGFNTNDLF